MIRMFVGNQDGVELLEFPADRSQARQGFAFTEACVNKDAGAFGFEQG